MRKDRRETEVKYYERNRTDILFYSSNEKAFRSMVIFVVVYLFCQFIQCFSQSIDLNVSSFFIFLRFFFVQRFK